MNEARHLSSASSCPQIDGDKMTLYGMRYCPYTHRVHLILNAKEVSYNTVNINLRDKPEWFQQKSSSGKVPALEIPKKNITIHDSMIISEYLNDTYVDPQLHRPDPLDRSLDRLLIDKFNAVISPLYKVLTSKSGLTGVEEHLQNFMNNLDVFENELGTRETKFFTGNRPGMVDYMIWPWIESSEMIYYIDNSNFELDIFRFPKVRDWITAMKNDDAVKLTKTAPENHFKFFQTYNKGQPDYDMFLQVD